LKLGQIEQEFAEDEPGQADDLGQHENAEHESEDDAQPGIPGQAPVGLMPPD
jgi:hypothetical protein